MATQERLLSDLITNVYASVLEGKSALYCSAPITSGKRFIDWLDQIGKNFKDIDDAGETYRSQHIEKVIEPNREHAQHFIRQLRKRAEQVVIDPTAFPHVSGWTQPEWRAFWQQVIERYAQAAYFVDNWQYSNGCVFEFWITQKNSIAAFNEEDAEIDLKTGLALIEEATREMKALDASTEFLDEIQKKLVGLRQERESIQMENTTTDSR